MRELLWRAVARMVTTPAVTDWLIAIAQLEYLGVKETA